MELDHDSARLCLSQIAPSWGWIGGDLWLLIFSRLPIETLCRFRSVCKSWNSLISSPFFINLHHSVVSSADPHLKSYLLFNVGGRISSNRSPLYRPQSEAPTEPLRQDLYFPFRHPGWQDSFQRFVDVVRGVVCATYSVNSEFDSTVLWNPAICKFGALPQRSYPSHLKASLEALNTNFAIGFGYDQSNNDFKVVRIWIPWNESAPTYVVYSARQDLWKEAGIIPNITNHCEASKVGRFINGAIHWLLTTPSSVLMFDCELEEFTTMEFPREIYDPSMEADHKECTILELMEHTGLLSVLVRRNHKVELWVMQEHGVWEKLYRIRDGYYNQWIKSFGIRGYCVRYFRY